MVFNPSMFTAEQWTRIFPPEYLHKLEGYLGENIEVLRTEVISVPAHSEVQHTHRDHSIGSRVSVCVAILIGPLVNVGTLFIPGSHVDGSLSPVAAASVASTLTAAATFAAATAAGVIAAFAAATFAVT